MSEENTKPEGERTPQEVEAGIIKVLDDEIRPAVARDGGDIEFVEYRDSILRVRLQGACKGCPGAAMTLKMGVEGRLKRDFPELECVEAVQ